MEIIYPQDGWILKRSGEELEGLEGTGTYFINYYLYDETKPRPHGALFTHIEPATEARFRTVAQKVDYAVCLNRRIKDFLIEQGIKHVEIIPHGHDPRVKRRVTFGVVGKVYPTGRKGEHLVKRMLDAGYDVIAWGEGWPCPTYSDWSELPWFYKEIDYLVVTSLEEGGPVPVIDAIASGVPVVAPDVGWCWEYPCIRYKKGDWESLQNILNKLVNPPTWENWKNQHQKLFRSCLTK